MGKKKADRGQSDAPRGNEASPSQGRITIPRRHFLAGGAGLAAVGAWSSVAGAPRAAAAGLPEATPFVAQQSSSMYIVAHADDTLLFQSPQLLADIQSGRHVTAVYLTAGDDGQPKSYWSVRESGTEAAFASMANAANTW